MNIELVGWHDEHSLDHRRRLRNAMLVSLALHASLFAVMVIESSPTLAPMPEFISIELLAALPTTSRPARPKPTPPPAAEPAPPEPAPPEPPVTPPVTRAPVQVLPEESPGRILEARPEPKPVPRRPVRERELSYEEAMAALDDELGVDETVDLLRPAPAPAPVEPEDSGAIGRRVSSELVAWSRAVQRLIRNKWVTPSNFRNRGLTTSLEVRLSATGAVIGTPIVVRSSGDPFFDDNAVRALLTVAPLPPPPEPGLQVFIFNAEGN